MKAILFDFDGTLVNTDPLHYRAYKQVLEEEGLPLERPFYDLNMAGKPNMDIMHELFPDRTPADKERIVKRKESLFRDWAGSLEPTAGLMDLLEELANRNIIRAVVTSAPAENVSFMLRALGLDDAFSTIVLADTLPKGKPDPMPYQVGLERTGVEAHEALAFEDAPLGVQSASGAGILTVGLSTTQAPEELLNAGARYVIENFLDPLVLRLLAEARVPY